MEDEKDRCRASWTRNGVKVRCGRPARARKLCMAHYKQKYDGRSFGPIAKRSIADDRFGDKFPRNRRGK